METDETYTFSLPEDSYDVWEINGELKNADYVAKNGDRYFSFEDIWVVVSYNGPNEPRSIRIEQRGSTQ